DLWRSLDTDKQSRPSETQAGCVLTLQFTSGRRRLTPCRSETRWFRNGMDVSAGYPPNLTCDLLRWSIEEVPQRVGVPLAEALADAPPEALLAQCCPLPAQPVDVDPGLRQAQSQPRGEGRQVVRDGGLDVAGLGQEDADVACGGGHACPVAQLL